MVIYNVSKIDPILVPVLRSDFIIEGKFIQYLTIAIK